MSKQLSGHVELLFPSKYIKAADLRGKDVTIVIAGLVWEQLIMQGGKRDTKVAISMKSVSGRPLDKKWIAPKTALRQIAQALGEKDVAKWVGQKVSIFPTTCRGADGGTVECIRVRVQASSSTADPPADMTAPIEPRDFAQDAGDAGSYQGGPGA